MLLLVGTAVEAGARQQALSEFFSLIEGRDMLLTHADKQLTQLHRQLAEKQASRAASSSTVLVFSYHDTPISQVSTGVNHGGRGSRIPQNVE